MKQDVVVSIVSNLSAMFICKKNLLNTNANSFILSGIHLSNFYK